MKRKTCLTEERKYVAWIGRTVEEKKELNEAAHNGYCTIMGSAGGFHRVRTGALDLIEDAVLWVKPEYFDLPAEPEKPDRVELDIEIDCVGYLVRKESGKISDIGYGVVHNKKYYTVIGYRFKDGSINLESPLRTTVSYSDTQAVLSDTPTEVAVKVICEVLV